MTRQQQVILGAAVVLVVMFGLARTGHAATTAGGATGPGGADLGGLGKDLVGGLGDFLLGGGDPAPGAKPGAPAATPINRDPNAGLIKTLPGGGQIINLPKGLPRDQAIAAGVDWTDYMQPIWDRGGRLEP